MKKLLFCCAALAIFGCGDGGDGDYAGSYSSVYYEGQTYKTIVIGKQTWFAENLNYNAPGSKCYGDNTGGDNQDRCGAYGRLYNWETAMTICPSGWHLPSQEEWNALSRYVQNDSNCNSCDASLLKATSGWNSDGNGTDSYGFSALPGGYGIPNGSFNNVGLLGYWWSATEYNSNNAYVKRMYYSEGTYLDIFDKSFLYSVRCLQD